MSRSMAGSGEAFLASFWFRVVTGEVVGGDDTGEGIGGEEKDFTARSTSRLMRASREEFPGFCSLGNGDEWTE